MELNNIGRRMFSDAYDYSNFRDCLSWNDLSGTAQFLARLRLDSIVSSTIVMTDSQFLHSVFLFNLADTAAFKISDLPLSRLQIALRASTIEQTLMEFVKGKDSGAKNLVHHIFPALDLDGSLAEEVATYPRSSIRSWKDVPRILKKASADPARVEQMERSWALAIELSRIKGPHGLSTAKWRPGFDFVGSFRSAVQSSKDEMQNSLKTERGISALKESEAHLQSRSWMVSYLGKLRAQKLDSDELSDINTIEAWFNGCYNSTIAQQHGCDDVEIFDKYHCAPFDAARRLFDCVMVSTGVVEDVLGAMAQPSPVKLSKGFLSALARMNSEEFERLLVLDEVPDNLKQWQTKGNWECFEKVCDRLIEEVDKKHQFDADLSRINLIAGRGRLLTGTSGRIDIARYSSIAGLSTALSYVGSYLLPLIPPEYQFITASAGLTAFSSSKVMDVILPASKQNADLITKRSMVKSELLNYAASRMQQSPT